MSDRADICRGLLCKHRILVQQKVDTLVLEGKVQSSPILLLFSSFIFLSLATSIVGRQVWYQTTWDCHTFWNGVWDWGFDARVASFQAVGIHLVEVSEEGEWGRGEGWRGRKGRKAAKRRNANVSVLIATVVMLASCESSQHCEFVVTWLLWRLAFPQSC